VGSGERCINEMCPGRGIFVEDFYDTDEKNGAKIPWKSNQTMEHYYEKLLTRFEDPDEDGTEMVMLEVELLATCRTPSMSTSGTTVHVEEKDMLDATEELAKRAMVKARLDYDSFPELYQGAAGRHQDSSSRAQLQATHNVGNEAARIWARS
jgi:hypothetical protein